MCEEAPTDCDPNPCQHEGACADDSIPGDNNVACTAQLPTAYFGDVCEEVFSASFIITFEGDPKPEGSDMHVGDKRRNNTLETSAARVQTAVAQVYPTYKRISR